MQTRRNKLTTKPERFDALGSCAFRFVAANTGSWRLERPEIDFSSCVKCGICEKNCPVDAITIHKDRDECVSIMWDYCKGCGICANECPGNCISMAAERQENNDNI